MRGKKTDINIKAKIIEERINNDTTGSDIARKLDIPERTVNNILDTEFAEVCQKSEKVAKLIDTNNNLQSLADGLIEEMIINKDKSITIAQLTSLRESTFKQNQLIGQKPTEIIEIDGGQIIKDIESGKIKKENAYELLKQIN